MRTLTRPHRPVLALVAALVVLGLTAGVAVAHGGRPGRRARGLAGTVTSIDATAASFVVDTRRSDDVTVQTNGETKFLRTADASVADAVVGSFVVAKGTRADGASPLAARRLRIVDADVLSRPFRGWHRHRRVVAGKVVANVAGTLTVDDGAGDDETVTTSPSTRVTRTSLVDFDTLEVGDRVTVAGVRAEGDDDAVVARRVHIHDATRAVPAPPTTSSTTSTTASPTTTTTGGAGAAAAKAAAALPAARPPASPVAQAAPAAGARAGAFGRVASVAGQTFVLATPMGPKTVTTTGATTFITTVDATVADITAGDRAAIDVFRAPDGTLVARRVRLRETADEWGRAAVFGTVVSNTGGVLTVSTPGGTRTVATTADTRVTRTAAGSLADVVVGARAKVAGTLTGPGSITAEIVHVDRSTLTAFGDGFRDRDRRR